MGQHEEENAERNIFSDKQFSDEGKIRMEMKIAFCLLPASVSM
jgi:hypothetical protein